MNKVINIFSGITMAVFCILVMAITYDLSISSTVSLKDLAYKEEICGGFALVILLLGVLRMRRRWQGFRDMKKFNNFTHVFYISKSAKNLSLLFTLVETGFIAALLFFMYSITKLEPAYVVPMLIVLAILFIDNVIFLTRIQAGGNSFRIGINDKVVAYFNREMHLYYYTGLKRIEKHQDMINFQYKEDLNLFLPLDVIQQKDRVIFKEKLIETMNQLEAKTGKSIYMDDGFRTIQ